MKNFALIGAAGYIAPRHLKAIQSTGHQLVAALDPSDSVGILDRYFPETHFFVEPARFERYLQKQRYTLKAARISYISICSPNYLHDAHIRMALRAEADAICEKPIVITPWNLEALKLLEQETGQRVFTVLQLRLHPSLVALKQALDKNTSSRQRADVTLTYITQRGPWYDASWKGSEEKSGGLVMNIGVHFFDVCLWLFGPVHESAVHLAEPRRMAGALELERARVKWFLSIQRDDIPENILNRGQTAYRSILIDGKELEFSQGFTDLHTEVYRNIFAGKGLGIDDARPSIELVYEIRHTEPTTTRGNTHPYVSS